MIIFLVRFYIQFKHYALECNIYCTNSKIDYFQEIYAFSVFSIFFAAVQSDTVYKISKFSTVIHENTWFVRGYGSFRVLPVCSYRKSRLI